MTFGRLTLWIVRGVPKSFPPISRNPHDVELSVRSSLALSLSRGIFAALTSATDRTRRTFNSLEVHLPTPEQSSRALNNELEIRWSYRRSCLLLSIHSERMQPTWLTYWSVDGSGREIREPKADGRMGGRQESDMEEKNGDELLEEVHERELEEEED